MGRNLASLWEAAADAVPDAPALAHGATRRTWRALDERAARLAEGFRRLGLGADSKIALFLYNGPEYLECTFGAFKLRAVPVNVNYRYLAEELVYLIDNADAEVLVFDAALAERVNEVRSRLPRLRALLQVGGSGALVAGAHAYEDVIAAHPPMERLARDGSEIYMLYTGGTTGLPKGVMWQHETLVGFYALPYMLAGVAAPEDAAANRTVVRQIHDTGKATVMLPACPLMHGTGWLMAMAALSLGGAVVTTEGRTFDADELWQTVERQRVTQIVIVGDAFGKPMVSALERATAAGRPYDLSSVEMIVSSGVMWSASVKKALQSYGSMMLFDSLGSSEGLGFGAAITAPGQDATTARFTLGPTCKVLTDDGREVAPGSGEIGVLALSGNVPLGYYKDPAKSAATFREIGGQRYSIPGDYATVEADGSITLLGRGSVTINTAGEKVHAEEVEEAIKEHPGVEDCLVIGVPDDKWGHAVTAVVALRSGLTASERDIITAAKQRLAAYKAPKRVVFVEAVKRAPNAKADYAWARATALERLGISPA